MTDGIPQTPEPLTSLSRGQLHIIAVLQHHGQILAEIHQMVSPPETRDEPTLRDILGRIAEALDRQTTALDALSEQVNRISAAAEKDGPA